MVVAKELLLNLTEYLAIATSLDWRYYSDPYSSQMEPKGAVILLRTTSVSNQKFLDYFNKNYRFKMRLLISNSDSWLMMQELLDWQEKLINEVMRSLSLNGYKDMFEGIQFVEATQGVKQNQDNGATGVIELLYDWGDDSKNSEQYSYALGKLDL